jgi:pimeloyl-ACP methyl ester carboxylesterase
MEKGVAIDLFQAQGAPQATHAIVLLHGLAIRPPGARSPIVRELLRKGYCVVAPHYLGTHDSTGEFSILNSVSTVKHAVKAVGAELPNVTDFSIFGYSYGGAIAMVAGAQIPEVRKIISIAGPPEWRPIGRDGTTEDVLYHLLKERKRQKTQVNPGFRIKEATVEEMEEGAPGLSPIDHVDALKDKDVMLLHPQQDEYLPPIVSKAFHEILLTGNGNHLMFTLRGGHSMAFSAITGNAARLKRVLDWLKT